MMRKAGFAAVLLLALTLLPQPTTAQAQSQAGLLIRYGETLTFSIDVADSSTTTLELYLARGSEEARLVASIPASSPVSSIDASVAELGLNAVEQLHYQWVLIDGSGQRRESASEQTWYAPGGPWFPVEASPALTLWLPETLSSAGPELAENARQREIEVAAWSGVLPGQARHVFVLDSLVGLVQAASQHGHALDSWSPVLSSDSSRAALIAWDGLDPGASSLQRDLRAALVALDLAPHIPPYPAWYLAGMELGGTDADPTLAQLATDQLDSLGVDQSLCSPIEAGSPVDPMRYAAAASFFDYLRGRYGVGVFNQIGASYQSGAPCSEGLSAALGIPLAEIDGEWRASMRRGSGPADPSALAMPLVSLLFMSTLLLLFAFQPGRSV